MLLFPALPRYFSHWQKPPKYLLASLIVSIGGLLNGYVSISIPYNGALQRKSARNPPPAFSPVPNTIVSFSLLSTVLCTGTIQLARTWSNLHPPNSLDTGVIGPVTTMPTFTDYFGHLSSSQHGIVVSSIMLSATAASLFAGSLSDTMGRSRAVAIGSLVFAVGAALEAAATTLAMFIAGRIIVGVGEGLFLSTLVV